MMMARVKMFRPKDANSPNATAGLLAPAFLGGGGRFSAVLECQMIRWGCRLRWGAIRSCRDMNRVEYSKAATHSFRHHISSRPSQHSIFELTDDRDLDLDLFLLPPRRPAPRVRSIARRARFRG